MMLIIGVRDLLYVGKQAHEKISNIISQQSRQCKFKP